MRIFAILLVCISTPAFSKDVEGVVFRNPGHDVSFGLSKVGKDYWLGISTFVPQKEAVHLLSKITPEGKRKAALPLSFKDVAFVRAMDLSGPEWVFLVETLPPAYENLLIFTDSKGKEKRRAKARKSVEKQASSFLRYKKGFLVYGTELKSDRSRDGWLLCLDGDGTVLWDRSVDFGKDESVLFVVASDGGFVSLVESGKFNRFGQGPSSLRLVKHAENGKTVSTVEIPEGRANTKGGPILLKTSSGFYVSYTKTQLPDVKQIDYTKKIQFDAWVASVTPELKLAWNKEMGKTDSPGTPLLGERKSTRLLLGGKENGAWIQLFDSSGSPFGSYVGKATGRYSVESFLVNSKELLVVGHIIEIDEQKKDVGSVDQNIIWHRFPLE